MIGILEKKLYTLGFVKTTENKEKVCFQRMRKRIMEIIRFNKKEKIVMRDTLSDAVEDSEISEIVNLLKREYFND